MVIETKNKIKEIMNMIKKDNGNLIFYNSVYIILLALIVLITWSVGASLVGISIIIGLASLVVALQKDTLPVVPLLLISICCTSDNTLMEHKATIPTLIILFSIFAVALIIHIVRFKPKFKNGSLSLPLLIVSIALMIGGTTVQTKEQFFRGIIFALALGFVMLALYQILYNTFCTLTRKKMQKYMAQLMLVFSLLICAQVVIWLIKHDANIIEHLKSMFSSDNTNRSPVDLGWTNRAGAAYMITILLPGTFYLSQVYKKTASIFYLLAFVQFFCCILTISRSGIIFSLLEILLMVIYIVTKGKNRSPLIFMVSASVIIAAAVVLAFKSQIAPLVDKFIDGIFTVNTSGRIEIYKNGMEKFLESPIFGYGLGMDAHDNLNGPPYIIPPNCIYWLHSTPIQILASMGIIGVIAYGMFYYKRFKMLFKHQNAYSIIMSLGIVVFEIYSLIDSGTFIPFPTFLTILIITISLELSNKSIEDELRVKNNLPSDCKMLQCAYNI